MTIITIVIKIVIILMILVVITTIMIRIVIIIAVITIIVVVIIDFMIKISEFTTYPSWTFNSINSWIDTLPRGRVATEAHHIMVSRMNDEAELVVLVAECDLNEMMGGCDLHLMSE